MSIIHYFQRSDGLPDPRGALSNSLPPRAIALANSEIRKANQPESRKRGTYHRYSPEERAKIGHYAHLNGVAAASRFFTRKMGHPVATTTVLSIKKAYLKEKNAAAGQESGAEVRQLPHKARGRPLLLGPLDSKVQLLLKKIRDNGGTVNTRIAIAAAKGILLYYNPPLLLENGGYLSLTRNWALSLLERMDFVKRKSTTAKSRGNIQDFLQKKEEFLKEVAVTVEMEGIPAELILNWDQTGVRIVPSSNWTMEKKGSQRVELTGVNDKRQVTAVLCGNMFGDFLPLQIIYKGKTSRCHPHYEFPDDWNITHSPNHWSTEETMLEYLENIICPYVEGARHRLKCDSPALVIIDNFKGQITPSCISRLESCHIHTCLLPANTTDSLQPLDVSVNKPFKDFLRRQFDEWYTNQITQQLKERNDDEILECDLEPIDLSMTRMKEISAHWLVLAADYISQNPSFLVNGFIKAGITGCIDDVESDNEEDKQDEEETITIDSSDSSDEDVN